MINPLVSCLCVTRNNFSLLSRAIDCFDKQTYPNKELVILCEDNNPNLSKIKQLESREDVVLHIQPALPKLSLGKLRNMSIQISHGEYFCQWDDDDWYHPNRIQDQYSFIINSDVSGCYLDQRIVYDSIEKQLYISELCKFEGSIMMKKSMALKTSMYSNKNKAEDTDFVFPLIRSGVLVPLHAPHLYVYTHHGNNVWHKKHFEEIFNASQKIIDKDLENKLTC
jgi:glycosyltransferase involved in cell wall biosynthesis